MWKVINSTLDHTKRFLHRRASKMVMEPVIAGQTCRLRSSIMLTDVQKANNEAYLAHLVSQGVVTVEEVGGSTKVAEEPAGASRVIVPPPPAEVPEPAKELAPEPVAESETKADEDEAQKEEAPKSQSPKKPRKG